MNGTASILFNLTSNALAFTDPTDLERQELEEAGNADSKSDSFEKAGAKTPRFDTGSNSNKGFIEFNPLSLEFGETQEKPYTAADFNGEVNEILEALSNKDLRFEDQVELGKKLDDLFTEKFDKIQVDENAPPLTEEEIAETKKLADDFKKLTDARDKAFKEAAELIEDNAAKAGGDSGAPVRDTAKNIREQLKNIYDPTFADTARRLRGELAGIRPDFSSLGQFADLVAKRRQAKLEQEAIERRLSTQIDRLMGVVRIKDSIKLASSTA